MLRIDQNPEEVKGEKLSDLWGLSLEESKQFRTGFICLFGGILIVCYGIWKDSFEIVRTMMQEIDDIGIAVGIVVYFWIIGKTLFIPVCHKLYNRYFKGKSRTSKATKIYENGHVVGYKEGYEHGYGNGFGEGQDQGTKQGHNEGNADGYEVGRMDGHEQGYDEGHTKGYEYGYGEGFGEGQDQGYNEGMNDGYQIGHMEGHEQGHGEGHTEGYEEGLEDGVKKGRRLQRARDNDLPF